MTGITSVSRNQLKNRRQELLGRRRLKALQAVWRFVAIAGMAGGLFWALSMPDWMLGKRSHIEVEGEQLLSKEQIRDWVPLSKPQSFWQLPTQETSDRLEAIAPIAEAQITRQILPPKLIVEITERQPRAIAITAANETGFLDNRGVFIAKSYYDRAAKNLPHPSLKVIGYREIYRRHWLQIYPLIERSTIEISQVDWRNPNNLILKTEMGIVHLGSNPERFAEQLTVLAKMRQLSSRVPTNRIVYIDLTDPNQPTLRLKKQKMPAKNVASLRNH
jgi:cell division protein FtsQ